MPATAGPIGWPPRTKRPPVALPAPSPPGGGPAAHAAQAILERQRSRESAARTYARSFPIVPVRAQGMTVTGADGRAYLDCLAGAGTLALGHNHPAVLAAIRGVLESGAPLHVLDLATPIKDAFTETLFSLLPARLRDHARIHFCGPTGTDAVEAALKLARIATGRRGVLAFTGAYHGMTAGATAASGSVAARASGATSGEVYRLPYPHPYRCPFGVGGEQGARLAAAYAQTAVDDASGGVTPPGAMLLECVQGEGGVVPAPRVWLRAMRELTAARGIPLIVDEVQTGVGRTGTMWAVEHAEVTPDILVLSKAIGGGLPLAVVVYRDDLDVWPPGAHTGTFRGDQLALAAGAATLAYVAEHRLDRRAAEVGGRMLQELRRLAAAHPEIGDVRGRGLMIGIELVDPDGAPDPAGAPPGWAELARAARAACLRRGLIVELGGRHDTVVRLLPPLTITDDEATAVLERFADAVAEITADPPRARPAAPARARALPSPTGPRRSRG